jgi:hypothetical protein
MTHKELQKLKAAANAIQERCKSNPAFAREMLVKTGYLNEDGTVAYPYNSEPPRGNDFSWGPGE